MKEYKFVYLLWQFNMLLDSGKYDNITVSHIKEHIRNNTISTYLTSTFPDGDFSMIEAEEWDYLTNDWEGLADHVDEDRKMGVINKGLCLLLAYTINGLQTHPERQARRG